MLTIPKEIDMVSVIFMFLDREQLAPRAFPPEPVMPITMTQPGTKPAATRAALDRRPTGFRVIARYANENRYDTGRVSDDLLDQDFALVSLWHSSRERVSGEVEFGCKFMFARHGDPNYRNEVKRLQDFDRLTKGMRWKCSIAASESRIRMVFFSPRIVEEPIRACA